MIKINTKEELLPFSYTTTSHSIKFAVLLVPHLEELTISNASSNSTLLIRNLFIPPTSSCSQGYTMPSNQIYDDLNDTSIILGDFNAHHQLWHSLALVGFRGKLIADTLSEAPFGVYLAPHQHGFRKEYSTVTALEEISDHVTKGINRQKPAQCT